MWLRDHLARIKGEIASIDKDISKLWERKNLLEEQQRGTIIEIINNEKLLDGLVFCYHDINDTYTLFRRHIDYEKDGGITEFLREDMSILYIEPEINLYRSEYDLFLQFETKIPPSYIAKKYGVAFDSSSIGEKKKALLLQVLGLDQIMDMVKK